MYTWCNNRFPYPFAFFTLYVEHDQQDWHVWQIVVDRYGTKLRLDHDRSTVSGVSAIVLPSILSRTANLKLGSGMGAQYLQAVWSSFMVTSRFRNWLSRRSMPRYVELGPRRSALHGATSACWHRLRAVCCRVGTTSCLTTLSALPNARPHHFATESDGLGKNSQRSVSANHSLHWGHCGVNTRKHWYLATWKSTLAIGYELVSG